MNNRGFTLIEMIVIMALVVALTGFITLNVVSSQRRASLIQVSEILASDMHNQQAKAMTGDAVGGVVPTGYGIHFESNKYVLFTGSSYNALETTNTVIPVTSPASFSAIGFPNNMVVFLARSGDIANYVSGSDYVTLSEGTSGQTKTIHLNRYGVDISTN